MTVLALIFRMVLALLAFRLIGDAMRAARSRSMRRPGRPLGGEKTRARERTPDYRNLTPYDIEDADYEDLPGREG